MKCQTTFGAGKMYWSLFFSLIFGSALGLIVSIFRSYLLLGFLNNNIIGPLTCRVALRKHSGTRYFAGDFDSRDLLFIGVLTAKKYLDTRAEAVYNTWGKQVPGKMEFFVSRKTNLTSNLTRKLPVRMLDGVQDNEYPPQKKMMTMLRYMHDHYIDDYQWFMRADDDVYVRAEELEDFLRKFDSSEDTIVGQGGVGKNHEVNKLGLLQGECYCIGGPGVIMSRNVLKKIVPHIDECLKDTVSSHEDVELGRCIRKFAGVSCLWAREAKDLFQQVYKDQENAYHGQLTSTKINKALTLHPVKDPAYMFRLHFHFLSMKLHKVLHSTFKHKAVLKTAVKGLSTRNPDNTKVVHRPRNVDFYKMSKTGSAVQWEFLTTRRIFDLQSQHYRWFHRRMMEGLNKALGKAMHSLDTYYSALLGRNKMTSIQLKQIDYGYIRVHPTLGVQYSFALQTKVPGIQFQYPWKPVKTTHHRTYAQHGFSEIQANVMEDSENSEETIHFIVPLKGKFREFKRFLESLRQAFLTQQEKITVLVVFFPDNSPPGDHFEHLKQYKLEFPTTNFLWVNIPGEFNRAKALQKGAEYFGSNSLLFFSDVDLVFRRDFAGRCRSNTIQTKQAYFPIMFGQYNREVAFFGKNKPNTNFTYANNAGTWRVWSFGPVCIFASDVKAVGGLDTSIKGWGMEDVNFADRVIKTGLVFFRAQDPGIVHVFHAHAPCSESLSREQRKMCYDSTISTYAPRSSLVSYMFSKGYLK